METIKVKVVESWDRLNRENDYCVKISGVELESGKSKEMVLDVTDLTIDQIGLFAGLLDARYRRLVSEKLAQPLYEEEENK